MLTSLDFLNGITLYWLSIKKPKDYISGPPSADEIFQIIQVFLVLLRNRAFFHRLNILSSFPHFAKRLYQIKDFVKYQGPTNVRRHSAGG